MNNEKQHSKRSVVCCKKSIDQFGRAGQEEEEQNAYLQYENGFPDESALCSRP